MKSFYEMWMMLEDYDAWLQKGYDDGTPVFFSRVLGEDEDDPFSLEVSVDDGDWAVKGSVWVAGYVPNGSENPASKPMAYTAGQKAADGVVAKRTGTEFMNPGRGLELLPASIRAAAVAWVNKEVEEAVSNYHSDDQSDPYDDRDDYNPDPDGHGYWDNYWKHGPGRDPD